MFTGLVEATGRVVQVAPMASARQIRIRAGLAPELRIGQSISLDGACQTVVAVEGEEFTVQAVETTLSRTTLGGWAVGRTVNLERSLALGDRLDGHLVQGHVDGVGHLVQVRRDGDFHLLEVAIPAEVGRQTLLHGSIALNGVSLTVNRIHRPEWVEVAIVPHTWRVTNLSELRPGEGLNVEADLIGKYVGTLLPRALPRAEGNPAVPADPAGGKGSAAGSTDPDEENQ